MEENPSFNGSISSSNLQAFINGVWGRRVCRENSFEGNVLWVKIIGINELDDLNNSGNKLENNSQINWKIP